MRRNVAFNLLGFGVPLVFAVIAIPLLLSELGIDRFGVLALAWSLIGYFSFLDLGLGRAVTKVVAERADHPGADLAATVTTSLALMVGLGIAGAIALVVGAHLLVELLQIPGRLQSETNTAFLILALSLPAVVSSSVLRGILEARQSFGLVNAVRIPLGIVTYLGPLGAAAVAPDLVPVVTVLVVSRYLAWLAYFLLVHATARELLSGRALDWHSSWPALKLGLWITVSNLVSPLMLTLDRFLIGAFLSLSLVAYYATPYEVVTKLWLVPTALTGVAFPLFASTLRSRPADAARVFSRTLSYELVLLFPIVLALIALGREGLAIWLGPDFASVSTRPLQWLALGVLLSSLSSIPFALVQAGGRADWTGKMYIAELPIYTVTLVILVTTIGITGAAIAWSIRMAVELVITILLSRRMLAEGRPALTFQTLSCVGLSIYVALVPADLTPRLLTGCAVLAAFALTAWRSGSLRNLQVRH